MGETMAQATRTFRIFVSSTFSDLKEERNALQKYVFPRLRELCARHGCRFQAIDLRWGVREEAALDQQTMRICLEEIARCQRVTPKPNFIVLLGDRYGWRPLPFAIPADELAAIEQRVIGTDDKALVHRWYTRDDNAVPPVYDLQPREEELKDSAHWEPVERQLRAILAAATADFAPDKRLKYFASATEQEIVLGAMDKAGNQREHVFGFFRAIKNLPHDRSAEDFVDLDEHGDLDTAAHGQLRKLKDRLRSLLPDNVHDYDASWQNGAPTTDHIGALPANLDACLALIHQADAARTLCVDVWRRLSQVILDQTALIEAVDPLDKEVRAHAAFGQERAQHFVGRTAILEAIRNYVAGTDNHPLVVYGPSGSGKTALMAEAIARCQSHGPKGAVVYRFIGATPSSSDGRTLLQDLCRQVTRLYGADGVDIPAEFQQLVQEFPKRLALATAEQPLLLFLDALDQLSESDPARTLAWLPAQLPAHVRLVVSTLPGDCLSVLERRLPTSSLVALEPMAPDDGRELLDRWLRDAGRTLLPPQRAEVLGKFSQVGLPLYLKLAFEDVRRWKSDANPEDTVVSPNISGVIHDRFARLTDDHGRITVERALGYLCAARRGLSEDEMLDVLSIDTDVFKDFRARAHHDPPEQRLPVIVWSRLYFDLEPYLTERDAHGTPVLNFYHRQLGEAAAASFLQGDGRAHVHSHLAEYFHGQDYFRETLDAQRTRARTAPPTPRPVNARKVDELPWQRLRSTALDGRFDRLEALLVDLDFFEAAAEGGMMFDLVADWTPTLASRPALDALRLLVEAIRIDANFVHRHPTALFQCLWNRCWWYDSVEARQHYDRFPGAQWTGPRTVSPSNAPGALSILLEGWQLAKKARTPGFRWVRSHRPPFVPIGTGPSAVLRGHEGAVTSVALSTDHSRIATASDATVRVWDVATGAELHRLRGHQGWVQSVALSADGRWLVSGGDDGVRVWDARSGEEIDRLPRGGGPVTSVAVSADGARVAFGSTDGTVRVWESEARRDLSIGRHPVDHWRGGVHSVWMSANGRRVVSGGMGGVRIWDADSGNELHRLIEDEVVGSVAGSDDGKSIVSTGGRLVRLWDAERAVLVRELSLSSMVGSVGSFVSCVALSGDGRRIVAGTNDGTVRVWDTATAKELLGCQGHATDILSVATDPHGRYVVTGSLDRTAGLWDLGGDRAEPLRLRGDTVSMRPMVSPDGQRIVCARAQHMSVWDAASGRMLRQIGPADDLRAVVASPDGRRFASICSGLHWGVDVWDTATGLPLTFLRTERGLRSVAFSPDGEWIVAANSNVYVWDAETGRELNRWRAVDRDDAPIEHLALATDRRRLAIAATDYSIRRKPGTPHPWGSVVQIFDPETGRELDRFALDAEVASLASGNGERVAVGTADGLVHVWEPDVPSRRLEAHRAPVTDLALSNHGRAIVSCTKGEAVRVWDPDTGVAHEILAGSGDVHAIAAGPAVFPFRALSCGDEITIEEASTARPLAWFQSALDHIVTFPAGRTWAGINAGVLHILTLEGTT